MDRRELIRMIAAMTGWAFSPADSWGRAKEAAPAEGWAGAKEVQWASREDIELLDEVAETILPRTDTPGARDARVGEFIARYSAACYPPEHIALLKSGIADIETQMRALHGKTFRQASVEEKVSLLVSIDRQAKSQAQRAEATPGGHSPHYFTLMKQLTLFGFFTSEAGATRVARYRPVPGKYKGCIPYVKGQTFWAW